MFPVPATKHCGKFVAFYDFQPNILCQPMPPVLVVGVREMQSQPPRHELGWSLNSEIQCFFLLHLLRRPLCRHLRQ